MVQRPENVRMAYKEICTSYHAVDDFRMKLMGLLPVATAGGIFLLVGDKPKLTELQPFFFPVGTFGFVVALGLFCYELYGIAKCHALINAGRELENNMHVKGGQFMTHPDPLAGFINEPLASALIYPAVLAAWVFVATVPKVPSTVCATQIILAACTFVLAFAVALFLSRWLKDPVGAVKAIRHPMDSLKTKAQAAAKALREFWSERSLADQRRDADDSHSPGSAR